MSKADFVLRFCDVMTSLADTPLVMVGGNGPTGTYFMQRLMSAGLTAEVISRRPMHVPVGFTKTTADLGDLSKWHAPAGAIIVSFLPLWILADFLPRFTGAKAIVATSSTSRFSKANSGDEIERAVANKLEQAEATLQAWAAQNKTSWTILRPTIIYDGLHDKNITRMANFIRRWHFLPVAAPASGLRQPIHFDDVANAAFICLENPAAANKAFNISGSEILSYRAMAERVFIALNMKPRFAMLPTTLLQKGFRAAAQIGLVKESSFGASMFQRMNEDLVFDTAEGLQILNYKPRDFKPEFPEVRSAH
jgi:uncharacterized protein YbjT (DUF2867 family)